MPRQLGEAFVRVRPDASGFGADLSDQTTPELAASGKASGEAYAGGVQKSGIASKLGKVAKVAGVALGGAAIYGAVAFTKNAVGLEQAFGKTMNMFQANSGATGKQMRQMSALALQMGKDTVFSASDAADAMLELAKNGMTPATIQAGALKQALTLAAAGGVGMEEAATVMGNALNAFGLKGKQAVQVSAALAGAANASSASIQSLSYGLQSAATSAHGVGFSIQETTGILAAFENAGIKGQDAGTSLKTMLQRLQPTTKSASLAMEHLGLFSKKTGSAFVNTNGTFKSATQIAGILQKHLGGLSDAQRQAALTTIFGSDATRAASILTNEGAKGLRKYIKATSDQKAAEKQAAAAMKGTAGAIEQRRGSVETLGLAFGQAIKPITIFVNKMIAGVANKAVPVVQLLGQKLREFIKNAGGMNAIMGHLNVGEVFGKIKSAISGISFDQIAQSMSSAGDGASKLGDAIGQIDWAKVKAAFGQGVSNSISVLSVVVAFLAKHLDTLAKILPELVVAFAAFRVAQAAANVASLAELPIRTAQILSNFALARAMKANTAQLAIQTGTQDASTAATKGGVVATIASRVASLAAAAASKAWAAGQWVLNAALSANPIGIVVVAIAGLVAGLIIAYKKSETFRSICQKAFQAVAAAGRWMWNNVLQPVFKFLVDAIAFVMKMWAKMLGALGHIPGFGWAKDASKVMYDAAQKASNLGDNIKKIPNHANVTIVDNVSARIAATQSYIDMMRRLDGSVSRTYIEQIRTKGPVAGGGHPVPAFASGMGRVTRPTLAVVGDAPEPENILRDSQLRELMRQAAGTGSATGATTVNIYDVDNQLIGTMRGEIVRDRRHAGVRERQRVGS
jgi:TP901 family phage tail tape measure protein